MSVFGHFVGLALKGLKLAINYLLDNCYFILGIIGFHQFLEIPMVSDPGTFMVNLFLYYDEREQFLQTNGVCERPGYFKHFMFIDRR